MPSTAGKRDAQQQADRLRIFRQVLDELSRDGVLTLSPEQEARLDRHMEATLAALARQYDIDTTESQKQVSWGMRVAATLGGLALCAAVVLFFYRYWGLLSTTTQVVVLALAPIAMLAATEAVARRERRSEERRVGKECRL